MSHNRRHIIISNMIVTFQAADVRSQFSTAQLSKIDQICAQTEPCDEDFRYLTRRLNAAYCADD
jgi:hypothetical protein